jgi:hypothetical protein
MRLLRLLPLLVVVALLPASEALFRRQGGGGGEGGVPAPVKNDNASLAVARAAVSFQARQPQVRRVCRIKGRGCLEYTDTAPSALAVTNGTISALGGTKVTGVSHSTELQGYSVQLDSEYAGEVENINTSGHKGDVNNLCIAGKLAPKFFLLGAQKSATTNFFGRLMEVALDVVPATPVTARGDPDYFYKEPHVFDISERYHGFGVDGWLRLYPDCSQYVPAIAMDASPSYISSPLAPARMQLWYGEALSAKLQFLVLLREPLARMQSSFYHGEQWSFHNMSFKQYVTRALANNRAGCPSGKAFENAAAVLECAEPDNMPMGDPFYLSLYVPQVKRWLSMYQARQFVVAPFLTYVAPKKGVGSLLHFYATKRLGSAVKKTGNFKAYPKDSSTKPDAQVAQAAGVSTQKPPIEKELNGMFPSIRQELEQVVAVNGGPAAMARALTPKIAEGLTLFGYSDKWAQQRGLGGMIYRERAVSEWIRINW